MFFCEPSPPSCTAFSVDVLVTASTELGSASITVHGICCPASLNIWVIPSFLPMIPIMNSSAESLDEAQLDCGLATPECAVALPLLSTFRFEPVGIARP